MPSDTIQGFKDFHDKIRTSARETALAKSHRASIEGCLKNNFGLNRFVRIGSFGNGTNISGHSDVDYLACLPRSSLNNQSSISLSKVKDALNKRFYSTNIKVSSPAVVCPFGTYKSEDTEIVVSDYIEKNNGFNVYEIADGNNGWMRISPDAHNNYVSTIDKKHGGKVKPLIRFIKAWKYYKQVPISSFYLEMRVAKYASSETSIIYDIDVKNIFKLLSENNLAAMEDPTGVGGYIYPCKTDAAKSIAISKLNSAKKRSENAMSSRYNDSISTAFYWWGLVYNDKFPRYN
ncbi:SMODS domain-containing nucleotidyltransferase [Marinomonas primoryensis]|uniref:SMODS domain-containing nucleotidyltransferase n=1 Tax=Marinomonas primoryensis TaxID=178399 RepID=UPI003703BF80